MSFYQLVFLVVFLILTIRQHEIVTRMTNDKLYFSRRARGFLGKTDKGLSMSQNKTDSAYS